MNTSFINRSQNLILILCWFMCFVQVVYIKSFCQCYKSKERQFQVCDFDKTFKSTKNIGFNWRKNGTFLHSFTCTMRKIEIYFSFLMTEIVQSHSSFNSLTKNLIFVFTLMLLRAFQGEFPMTSYWKEDKKGLIVLIW